MQTGAIERIREAEQEAGILLSRAAEEAEAILRVAQSQAEAAGHAARQDAEGIVSLRLEQAERMAESLKGGASLTLAGELAALDEQALNRRAAATEKILRLIGARRTQ